jgi:multisubunit Na+/H+ antiporter MnhE subunit
MKKLFAVFMLIMNFIKSAVISGFETAKIIIFGKYGMNSGLTDISYGELSENTASLLGAIITLTPGTTLVNIDTENNVMVLHMLDLNAREQTIKTIQRDFCDHLKALDGVHL